MKLLSSDPRAEYGTFQNGKTSTKCESLKVYCTDMFTAKPVAELEADSSNAAIKKRLSWLDLTLMGVGAIIGSGLFVLTGVAAGNNAGPAVVISFLVAGLVSGLAAMCYAEMASMIPVAGSAYTYTYATMGELLGWIIGWTLVLEYIVGVATVSVGWSSYVTSFISDVNGGVRVRDEWTSAPFGWNDTGGYFFLTGKYVNLPALIIVLTLTVLLVFGIKESAMVNGVIVAVKLIVLLIFIFASIKWVDPRNWTPFVPKEQGFGRFGASGVLQAASIVFFAYIGTDTLSTTAQECRNPRRDLPIGMFTSLGICTVLYVAVALCLTGVMPYWKLAEGDKAASPISATAEYIGQYWLAIVVQIGAIAGSTSVMLVCLVGQPRIMYSMASDGLLPACAAYTHPRFGTPVATTLFMGSVAAIMGALFPITVLSELTSIGTLFAFVLVSISVMVLRIRQPGLQRGFKVPCGPYGK